MRRPGRAGGFTLIELLVTLAIAAVVVSLAAPSLYAMIQRKRAVAAAEDLKSDLREAQRLAMNGLNPSSGLSNAVGVHFERDSVSACYIVYMQPSPRSGVECSCRTTPACPSLGIMHLEVIKTVNHPVSSGIRLQPMSGMTPLNEALLVFRARGGMLEEPVMPPIAQPYLTDVGVAVEAPGGGQLQVRVEATGRTKVCSVNAQHAGYPAC